MQLGIIVETQVARHMPHNHATFLLQEALHEVEKPSTFHNDLLQHIFEQFVTQYFC